MLYMLKVQEDLQQWQAETGEPLPADVTAIAAAEAKGDVIDLRAGVIVGHEAPDGDVRLLTNTQVHNQHAWLAGIEAACGGNVTIAWAVRPEEYFARLEAEKRA